MTTKTEVMHTPGPWKDGPVFHEEGRAIFFMDYSKPGKWQRRLDDKAGIFSEADARLLAAAPELLDALILAHNELALLRDQLRFPRETMSRIEAAIAKAEPK